MPRGRRGHTASVVSVLVRRAVVWAVHGVHRGEGGPQRLAEALNVDGKVCAFEVSVPGTISSPTRDAAANSGIATTFDPRLSATLRRTYALRK